MSSHSEKYPSAFTHHVAQLEKQSLKVCVLLFISSCILLLLPPSLWSCLPTPDTILRERGVHQLLKRLVVVKARKPRLKQSHLCSCHLVRHQFLFYPQEMLQTPTFGSCQSSWLYLFTSLLCRLALHLTSWAVQDPQSRLLTSALCTCFSRLSLVLFPVLQVATYMSPPPKSWQY